MDVDEPYDVCTNVLACGKDVIELHPMSANLERNDEYKIVIDYEMCQELIRVLQFIGNEIKP